MDILHDCYGDNENIIYVHVKIGSVPAGCFYLSVVQFWWSFVRVYVFVYVM